MVFMRQLCRIVVGLCCCKLFSSSFVATKVPPGPHEHQHATNVARNQHPDVWGLPSSNGNHAHSSVPNTASSIVISSRLSSSIDKWGHPHVESSIVHNLAAARSHQQQHIEAKVVRGFATGHSHSPSQFARDFAAAHGHLQHKVPVSLLSVSLDTWGSRDVELPSDSTASNPLARLRLSDPTFFGTHALLLQSIQVFLLLSTLILGLVWAFRSNRKDDKLQLTLTVGDEQQLSKADQLGDEKRKMPRLLNFNVIFNMIMGWLCTKRCTKRCNRNDKKQPKDGLAQWWKDGKQPSNAEQSSDANLKVEVPREVPRKAAMCVYQGVGVGSPKAPRQSTYSQYSQSPVTPKTQASTPDTRASTVPSSPMAILDTVEKVEFFTFYNDESDGESVGSDLEDDTPIDLPGLNTPAAVHVYLSNAAGIIAPPIATISDHVPSQLKGEKISMIKHPEIITDLPRLNTTLAAGSCIQAGPLPADIPIATIATCLDKHNSKQLTKMTNAKAEADPPMLDAVWFGLQAADQHMAALGSPAGRSGCTGGVGNASPQKVNGCGMECTGGTG